LLALYDQALPQVYGYLIARCRDRAVAEDLTSETLWAAAREDGPLTVAWLIGLERHKLVDHWRWQARQERLLHAAEGSLPEVVDEWDVILDRWRAHEVLEQLAPQHRAALTLRYLDGLSVPEAATMMARTVAATDRIEVLRTPILPVAPDPAFAVDLRDRLARAVLAPNPLAPNPEEQNMSTALTDRPRNGSRHGDVSYITLGLPDLARGRAFYGAVLGWNFGPGSSEQGAQVDDVVPTIGLWDGEQPAGGRVHGAVLGFRVDDIAAAVTAVQAHGGTVSDPHREPYAMAAEGHDDQGIPFYLHEMTTGAGGLAPVDGEFQNGQREGDVSYLTMVVPDIDAARTFYGAVFGWTFNVRRAGGAQVSGVAPQIGMTTQTQAGPTAPGVILCYRVDDIAAAVERVTEADGRSGALERRPYGLESLCTDDQGTPFYLHQF
jgi:RNA polymerase sigma-70 factor (ECF subfamily)